MVTHAPPPSAAQPAFQAESSPGAGGRTGAAGEAPLEGGRTCKSVAVVGGIALFVCAVTFTWVALNLDLQPLLSRTVESKLSVCPHTFA